MQVSVWDSDELSQGSQVLHPFAAEGLHLLLRHGRQDRGLQVCSNALRILWKPLTVSISALDYCVVKLPSNKRTLNCKLSHVLPRLAASLFWQRHGRTASRLMIYRRSSVQLLFLLQTSRVTSGNSFTPSELQFSVGETEENIPQWHLKTMVT